MNKVSFNKRYLGAEPRKQRDTGAVTAETGNAISESDPGDGLREQATRLQWIASLLASETGTAEQWPTEVRELLRATGEAMPDDGEAVQDRDFIARALRGELWPSQVVPYARVLLKQCSKAAAALTAAWRTDKRRKTADRLRDSAKYLYALSLIHI